MLPETSPAKSTVELEKLLDSLMFRDVTTSGIPFLPDPSQLLLMPPTGHPTEVEF